MAEGEQGLLLGVSVLARQVPEAQTAAERRLYDAVTRAAYRADPVLAPALAVLLLAPEGRRVSELEGCDASVKSTGTARERVEEISAFALSKAQTIEWAPEPQRTTLLTAMVRQLEAQAVDDFLDLFAVLRRKTVHAVERKPVCGTTARSSTVCQVTDDQWTPLSDRDAPAARALRDGVPASLELPLREWVRTTTERYTGAAERAAVRIDVVLYTEESGHEDVGTGERIAYWTPTEKLLDVTDALLDLVPTGGWQNTPVTAGLPTWQAALITANSLPDTQYRVPLQRLLNDAGSLYTIRADGRALVRRVDSAVAAVTDEAAKAADQPERGSATRHLRQALDAVYALQPDPVKAYSEAIKAVESAAHATLQPKHAKATLGTMLGEFRQVQAKLSVPIIGTSGTEGLAVVESMMDLLWTGQTSRHGNLQETRDETVQEAVMAVHLASTLVQLFASGAIRRS